MSGSSARTGVTTRALAVPTSQSALICDCRASSASTRLAGCSARHKPNVTSSCSTGVSRRPSSGPEIASPVICCHHEPVSGSSIRKFWLLMPIRRNCSVRPSIPRPHTRPVREGDGTSTRSDSAGRTTPSRRWRPRAARWLRGLSHAAGRPARCWRQRPPSCATTTRPDQAHQRSERRHDRRRSAQLPRPCHGLRRLRRQRLQQPHRHRHPCH